MNEIFKDYQEPRIIYKNFEFPLSITNFSLKEGAKIATYEYAGRNGAEHERVLSFRTFSLSGEFTYGGDTRTPKQLVNSLREQNDNKPGFFFHPTFGTFNCIVNNLTIDEKGEDYIKGEDGKYYSSYSFSLELYESTPPNSITLKEENNRIFSKTEVKPVNDNYSTKLLYKNCDELYLAIMSKKILPGVNPVVNAEWLRYDYSIRKCAYDKWKLGGFSFSIQVVANTETTVQTMKYIVKVGDTGTRIAKNNNVSFDKLFQANRGLKVRDTAKGAEGVYWKTARNLYPGDVLVIPK